MQYLLPEAKAQDSDKICVVIDLDETLVHSSFKVGPAQRLPAPGFLREPAPACEGSLHRPSPSFSRSFLLAAGEQCGLHHPCGD